MADKGFTIDDLLPLGVSLNIPPFLGYCDQMPPEDAVKTKSLLLYGFTLSEPLIKSKIFIFGHTPFPISYIDTNVDSLWFFM